jgi:hypothetical protein
MNDSGKQHSTMPPSVAAVLAAIEALPKEDRQALGRALRARRGVFPTYHVIPVLVLHRWKAHLDEHERVLTAAQQQQLRARFRAAKYKRGPKLKAERLRKRHRIIDGLPAIGISATADIFKHLQENYPDLVRKGKRDWIDPEWMMRQYHDSKQAAE